MRRLYCFILLLALVFILPAFSQQRWEKTYGGASGDFGRAVQQTLDGGYIVVGETHSYGANPQVYLIKTIASGDTLWTRNYWKAEHEYGWSVQQTSDTGCIVAGGTYSPGDGWQVYLIKTNASGDTLWTRTYGRAGDDEGYSVQRTTDGGYIVAGWTNSYGNGYQVFLVKTNASGDTLWTRAYGGTGDERGYSVKQTQDGGYIIAGGTSSFGNGSQFYLVKTTATGDTLWTRNYGGTGWEESKSVQETSDRGYIISGETDSFGNGSQIYLVKTNTFGDTLWTRTYGGTYPDQGYSVQQTSDWGYIIAGRTGDYPDCQVYLVKTNASGDTLWSRNYGGTGWDWGYSVQQTSDGGYIIAGETDGFGNGYQVYLIKTDANGSSGVEENAEGRGQRLEVKITAIPNPFVSFTTMPGHSSDRFALYDVSGRRVGTYKGDRIGENLPPGVYFLKDHFQNDPPVRIVKVK